MDGDSHSSLWSKISGLFSTKNDDNFEQVIMDARNDGELELEEGNMLLSILKLSETQVQDIMTPRTDIDCISIGSSIVEAAQNILTSGHSRLPIFQDTRDNIVGIIYAKDLLTQFIKNNSSTDQQTVDSIMREPYFIPETKISGELLQEFRSRKKHIAIVVDEYGGTSGLITIEDLLEVIVGDIEDEHDTPKIEDIYKITDDELLIIGRTDLEDLSPFGINLHSDEMDTLGGFLSLQAGHVPQKDEEFHFNGWNFIIVDADAKQIHKISAVRTSATSKTNA